MGDLDSKQVDIDALDPDELDALNLDDAGNDEPNPDIDKEPEPEKKEPDAKPKTEPEPEPETKEPEENVKPDNVKFEDMTPEQKIEHLTKNIKELRSGYTKEHLSKLELERKLKEAELDRKLEEVNTFQKMTPEEERELEEIDREAALAYRQEKEKYEKERKEAEEAQLSYIKETQDQEITAFIKDEFGIEIDPNIPIDQQPEEVKKIDEEIGKVADYLITHHKKLGGNGKYYTRKQFIDAHRVVNFNEILAREKAAGADIAVTAIERAKKGGSSFDKYSATGGRTKTNKASEYTPEEIDAMGPEELDSLVFD